MVKCSINKLHLYEVTASFILSEMRDFRNGTFQVWVQSGGLTSPKFSCPLPSEHLDVELSKM